MCVAVGTMEYRKALLTSLFQSLVPFESDKGQLIFHYGAEKV